MLAVTLATVVLLAGVYVLFARVFTRRRVAVHENHDLDPLLALPEDERDSGRRLVDPRRVAAGAILLALALTTFGIAVTVDLAVGAFWAAIGVGCLYAAVVFFEAAGGRWPGPN